MRQEGQTRTLDHRTILHSLGTHEKDNSHYTFKTNDCYFHRGAILRERKQVYNCVGPEVDRSNSPPIHRKPLPTKGCSNG